MKKLLSILLAAAMLLTITVTGSASEADTDSVKWEYNSEYDFAVSERSDGFQIVRTYENEKSASAASACALQADSPNNEENTNEKVKAILRSIGMEPAFIDELTQGDLQDYANSERIVGVITYSKADANGNVVTVPADEGMEAMGYTKPSHDNFEGGGIAYSETFEDSYMRLILVVSVEGNGLYKFSVDATWLTTPIWRVKDSLGACAQNIAIINDTRSGWYTYDYTQFTPLNYYNRSGKDMPIYIDTVANGNWDGSAAVFDLKNDVPDLNQSGNSITYFNHKMHYQFKAYVAYPESETYFNATATYYHTKINFFSDFSLQISTAGPSVSIGFRSVTDKDIRTVELDNPIHYIPH